MAPRADACTQPNPRGTHGRAGPQGDGPKLGVARRAAGTISGREAA
jgi:hypothetical protein